MSHAHITYIFIFLISEIITLITGIFLIFVPSILQRGLLFGVRVPEISAKDPEVIRMIKLYRIELIMILAGNMIGGWILFYFVPQSSILLCLYQVFALLFMQFLCYIPMYQKTKKLKRLKNWEVAYISASLTQTAQGRSQLRGIPWLWYIVSVIISILAMVISYAYYPKLPDTITSHWNASGVADAWSKKSYAVVFTMPIISMAMTLIMLGSNILLYFTKLQVSGENPVLSYAQHRLYRKIMGHMLGFMTLLITIMFIAIIPMQMNFYNPNPKVMMGCILIFSVLLIVPPIFIGIKVGQGGSKLAPILTNEEEEELLDFSKLSFRKSVDRGDDSNWILGLFYYNKEDPSVFIEDRFGMSGNMNYGRMAGKVIAIGLICITLTILIATTLLLISLI